jgi:hypothetical protein
MVDDGAMVVKTEKGWNPNHSYVIRNHPTPSRPEVARRGRREADPAHFNDRLVLGLKGTMSKAELHVLKARMLL